MDLQVKIRQALEAHKPAILALSQDLIRIPSQNPPGTHYRECVERIRQELDRLDLPHQAVEVPGDPDHPRLNLLGFHGEGRPTLYFSGHFDVVPAFRVDQFAPVVEGGRLLGRGAADMKPALAAMLYAAYLLKDLGVPLRGRIGLCFVGDEETGGNGGSGYLDRTGVLGKDAIAMITPEPTSGVIWNANRGAVTLRITVRGKAAHVGLQHQGVNAFEQMLEVVRALQDVKADVERRRTGYRVIPKEAAHSILMLGGTVAGGTNFNVVPEACSFTLERRFNPEEDLEIERARLHVVLDGLRSRGMRIDVDTLQEGFSCGVAEDHPVAIALAETIESVTGARPAFEMCPGLLEIRWFARKGIPAFAYGPGLLEVSHGPDEYVDIEEVYRHTIIYALLAARLLR